MTGLSATEQEMLAFWRTRLEEDDEAARDATAEYGTSWSVNEAMGTIQSDTGVDVVDEPRSPLPYIALHDPARVLRDVAAARARMKLLEEAIGAGHDSYDLAAALLPLELVAYDKHPGYKETWRP